MIYLSVIAIWAWFSLLTRGPLLCFFLGPIIFTIFLAIGIIQFAINLLQKITKAFAMSLAAAESGLYRRDNHD